MATGLSIQSVSVLCEVCDVRQDIPLVKDSRGYYHTPREHMCRVCGGLFLIGGSLCAYEVKHFSEATVSVIGQPQEVKHFKVGYNVEAAMMCHSEGIPDLMETEPPDEIDGEYSGIRKRLLNGICS